MFVLVPSILLDILVRKGNLYFPCGTQDHELPPPLSSVRDAEAAQGVPQFSLGLTWRKSTPKSPIGPDLDN